MSKNTWTREELILAFNLYLKLPFGRLHRGTPEVIQLAELIGRTPSAIAIRLTNFAHVDPYHQKRGIKGMSGGLRQVLPIWEEFIENKEELIFESEKILAEKEHQTVDNKYSDILFDIKDLKGETKIRAVKTRVNQNVFRQIVLVNYSNKCAVTGIDVPELLCARHIIPWASNANERLNPENGICLSSLYDRAFDKGLIGINEKYEIQISRTLMKKQKEEYYKTFFEPISGIRINPAKKYLPKKEFLEYHLQMVFKN